MDSRTPPVALALALSALLPMAGPPSLAAQVQVRSNVVGAAAVKAEMTGEGRFVFAGVGIDAYERAALWKPLDNAVNDVQRTREVLRDLYGFTSPDEWFLTDEAATAQAILSMVDQLRQNLQPSDNLVFFYAGHGAEVRDVVGGEEVGRTGFIVPVNVKGPVAQVPSQYINIQVLLEALARLPARHVLVILDSCYSGLALEASFKTRGGGETQEVRDLVSRVSRRILTSAQADQLAADGGAEHPKNSLFTGWLVTGLERAAAGGTGDAPSPDTDEDGNVTVTELYAFVRGRVGSDSQSRQTPDFGAFELDQRGELVLTLERDAFDEAYAAALAAFEDGDFDEVASQAKAALERNDVGPQAAFLRYLSADVADEPGKSLAALRELAALSSAGEEIPMSVGSLTLALRQKEAFCRKAGCAAAGS
ncbi:MAG: caspase family protein [Longimicrobiales bacterium]|nr:caspase family protein [Longimicrobiales bacterium]